MHIHDSAVVARVLSLRIAAGKVLLTLLGLFCGASIGREGPTVQVSASLMQALGALLRLPREQAQRALVLAGGAAGVSAAFNTPLAGVVFAIEELSHSFEARTSGTVLTAVIISGIATLSLVGNYAYFGTTGAQFDLGTAWVAVLLCGIAGGALGGFFSECLVRFAGGATGFTGRFFGRRPLLFAAVCGLGIAGLGLLSRGATYGTGYEQARGLVEGGVDLPLDFFLLKLIATTVSYLSGIPGGIFAPSLAIGAGLGHALTALMPDSPRGALVLLGMVGYFSGVVQAPITATVIVLEMTENQRMTIPLMATAMLAFGISRLICRRPLYGALARRFLLAVQGRR
jgi:H+/Cl- antiporter ClcA